MKQAKIVIIAALIVVSVIFGVMAVKVFAYDEPAQGTDNATDIIIWHGDNLTIENITIEGLEDALVAAAIAQTDASTAAQSTLLTTIIGFVIVILLAVLAYWHREMLLYIISGLAFMIYGFSYTDTSVYISALLVIAGIYTFIKAGVSKRGNE